MLTFNVNNFMMASVAIDYKDVEQFLRMVTRFRKNYDKFMDSTYTPSFKEIENGGIEAVTRQSADAMLKKALWLNSRAKSINGKNGAIIDGFVDMDNANQVLELCVSIIDEIDKRISA